MVGSYEYFRAVTRLEQLINMSTPSEVEVYDKLLGLRPEYTFHAGMYADGMFADSLDTSTEEGRKKFDERFLRKGLAWMIGLAKVELGATVSTYGDDRVEKPFHLLMPTPMELEAFLSIMHDDLQAHLIALPGEPGFAETTRRNRKPDSWTLAYLRRMKLMTDMMDVLHSVGNPQVSARLQPAYQEIAGYRKQMLKLIDRANLPMFSSYSKDFDLSQNMKFRAQDATCEEEAGKRGLGSPGSGTTASNQ